MLPSAMISAVVLRTQPDERLVVLAGRGSEAAFETLVQRYQRPLLAYCRRLLLSDSRSEDVVQQALLAAWTSLQNGAEVREVKARLYRIAHNQAVSARCRPGYDFVELHESMSGVDALEADLERRTLMHETLVAVAALPKLQREAILGTAVDGRSYGEVAAALGVTDKAVRGLIYRARLSVRSAMAAVAPAPLVVWAADQTRRCGGLAQWLTESVAGGGSAAGAAGAAVALKTAAVLASSAVVVGGTVTAALATHEKTASVQTRLTAGRRGRPADHRAASAVGRGMSATAAAALRAPELSGTRTGTPTTRVALAPLTSHTGEVGPWISLVRPSVSGSSGTPQASASAGRLSASSGHRSPPASAGTDGLVARQPSSRTGASTGAGQPSASAAAASTAGGPAKAVSFGPMSRSSVETTPQRTGDSGPASQAPSGAPGASGSSSTDAGGSSASTGSDSTGGPSSGSGGSLSSSSSSTGTGGP